MKRKSKSKTSQVINENIKTEDDNSILDPIQTFSPLKIKDSEEIEIGSKNDKVS